MQSHLGKIAPRERALSDAVGDDASMEKHHLNKILEREMPHC